MRCSCSVLYLVQKPLISNKKTHRALATRGSVHSLKTREGRSRYGVLCPDRAAAILRRHNATQLDNEVLGEVGLIEALARATVFVSSWGTALMKNYVYLGDDCGHRRRAALDARRGVTRPGTDVWVYHTNDFHWQLDYLENRLPRFRNARVHYVAAEDIFY